MQLRNDLIPQIKALFEKNNWPIDPEFNHGGINDDSNPLRDKFNDYRWVWRPVAGEFWLAVATTGPGANCIRTKAGGAALVKPGYYSDAHVIAIHAASHPTFAHEGFCQRPEAGCKPLTIYRLDRYGNPSGVEQSGNWFGINIHRASAVRDVTEIGAYSEGCYVDVDHDDHEAEMAMAKDTARYRENPKCLFPLVALSASDIYIPEVA